MTTVIGILAAGSSSRMRGRDKLLQPVDGMPLIVRQARIALATGLPVTVALPAYEKSREAALLGEAVASVPVAEEEPAMSASIRAIVRSLPEEASHLLLLLGDMPEVRTDDLLRLLRQSLDKPNAVVRAATSEGVPGHPVIFPRRLFQALGALEGDQGAKDILKREEQVLVALEDGRAIVDLDTPEDWLRWRARR
ncbi:nucleotidyltransferase family protein [Roseitranquillus sediminis]|uniref:nucleotidyltransferase family protein n=1 Tax=Roseitranquillus sediminis TaxID=2809051 RepID=UPI001D0C5096|nr:nucleotidyltransferase family protein [Roseitranquillus sediminis]